MKKEQLIELQSEKNAHILFGQSDEHLKCIEELFEIDIFPRGHTLSLKGPAEKVSRASNLILELEEILSNQKDLQPREIKMMIHAAASGSAKNTKDLNQFKLGKTRSNKLITPKTENQKKYIEAIESSDVVFGWGPAGTGKTYLAMAMAVQALLDKKVKRIILTRPAVEAGEKLGYLPGDLSEKVNPYLRPLLDALNDMMEVEKAHLLIEKGIIEVAPIAFMRGRSLNQAFVILDEAQNTTPSQMKMFLTRIGFGTKAVINGDITQVDLPKGSASGLIHALDILRNIKGIAMVQFKKEDIVRNPLIQKIVEAYEA